MLLTLFSRLLVRLLPPLALLCALIPVLGARPPAGDEAWQSFGFADCALPCFAGITPGQTPFSSTAKLLIRHVRTVDPRMIDTGSSVNFWARIRSQQLGGLARYDQGMVGELRLNVILPVAAVITQLGAPDCILPNTTEDPAHVTVIFWQRDNVSIAAVLGPDARALNLNANLLALWLSAVETNECSLRGALPWHGFAPVWDYAG